MDLRVAEAIPRGCARHVCHIPRAFSWPMRQKQIGGALTLSSSRRKSGVIQRHIVIKAASSGEYQFGSGGRNIVDANMKLLRKKSYIKCRIVLNASGRNIVDANMILLRKRMFDLKMQETYYKTPEEYMEWEKEVYPVYYAWVVRAME